MKSVFKFCLITVFIGILCAAMVVIFCIHLDKKNNELPHDQIPPVREDYSDSENPNVPETPEPPDGSTVPNTPDTPTPPDSSDTTDGTDSIDGSEMDTSTKPNMNPDQTRLELEAFLMGQEESRPSHMTDRIDYLDAEQFQEVPIYISEEEVDALGKSHAFYAITLDLMGAEPWCYYSIQCERTYYFILSDGSILVVYTNPAYAAKRYNTVAELPTPHIYGIPVWTYVSLENAEKVVQGMTYSEIVDLLGVPGYPILMHRECAMAWWGKTRSLVVFFGLDEDELPNDMSVATEIRLKY
ncbi:MAG: hypothetical protein E7599_02345 [Ruminococcaceae bacterium]|nr:hypothetical protein [Oscillospiraceae bacterium]